ncbi:hypothetical protein M6B38_255175 [Iris pallida]|uniref:Uncharacterized protein n=1 Tax=Iris pallida TaxID=29817 RepID=A0AAX6IHP9_IRIPA|nr:hypothetical protein M6B38_255175 [Iris pallida]
MMASHGRGPGRGGGGGGAGRGRGRTGAGGRGRIQSSRDVTPSSEPDPESIPSTDASRPRSTTSSRHQSGSASGSDPLSEPPAADQPGDAPVTAQWAPEYPHTRFHPVTGEYIRGPADPPTAPERPRGEFRRELWPAGPRFFRLMLAGPLEKLSGLTSTVPTSTLRRCPQTCSTSGSTS